MCLLLSEYLMVRFAYLRCPVCGKVSRLENLRRNHRPALLIQDIGGDKHIAWEEVDAGPYLHLFLEACLGRVRDRLRLLGEGGLGPRNSGPGGFSFCDLMLEDALEEIGYEEEADEVRHNRILAEVLFSLLVEKGRDICKKRDAFEERLLMESLERLANRLIDQQSG